MSDHDPNRAENVRLAIASQPSVEQGVAALLRTIATHLHEAIETNDMSQLKALADHINADPRAWSDALLANTPAATQTIAPSVPAMPAYVQDAFRDHSVLAQETEQREDKQRDAQESDNAGADQTSSQYPYVGDQQAQDQGSAATAAPPNQPAAPQARPEA